MLSLLKIKICLLSVVFSTTLFADCQDFISLKKFKTSPIDERLVFSILNDYKNIYQVEPSLMDSDKRLTYKFDNFLAIQFPLNDKRKVIIVFNDKTQLLSVIENNKILFCGDRKK